VIRLPKEHVAGGEPLRVKYANISGGSFRFGDGEILIGNKEREHVAVETLLHECLESSMLAHRVRGGCQTEEMLFVFDHRTFSVLCSELAATVLKMMKANGYKEKSA
jgi:hypothetical protein